MAKKVDITKLKTALHKPAVIETITGIVETVANENELIDSVKTIATHPSVSVTLQELTTMLNETDAAGVADPGNPAAGVAGAAVTLKPVADAKKEAGATANPSEYDLPGLTGGRKRTKKTNYYRKRRGTRRRRRRSSRRRRSRRN